MSMESTLTLEPGKHSVFISYSWDSDQHMAWVDHFSNTLEKAGIQTIVDRKDFRLGDPIPRMMEEAITKCEYVLFVCSANYKKKSDEHIGGVAYEDTIITAELYSLGNHRKFIPIFPNGKKDEYIPVWAKGKLGLDMSSSMKYYDGIKRLIHQIDPNLPFPIKSNRTERADIYKLNPYFQIKLFENLYQWAMDMEKGGDFAPIESTLFLLQDMETEKFNPEVMLAWKQACAKFQEYYDWIVQEAIQNNPD